MSMTPTPVTIGKAKDIAATLEERGTRYGSFTGHAHITQPLDRLTTIMQRAATIQERLLVMGPTWPTCFDIAAIWMRAA